MSHVAVQRVIVRMLYDAAFAERVYDDPGSALAGVDLTDAETAWLTASDPRAWRVDPLRRARTLKALLDEFSVSGAETGRRSSIASCPHRLFTTRSSPVARSR